MYTRASRAVRVSQVHAAREEHHMVPFLVVCKEKMWCLEYESLENVVVKTGTRKY